jgi:hypothetical protein
MVFVCDILVCAKNSGDLIVDPNTDQTVSMPRQQFFEAAPSQIAPLKLAKRLAHLRQ